MNNNYDIQFNNSFDHNLILNHNLIKDTYKKCNKYANSIFNTYDKTEYDTVYAIGDIHGDYNALIKILKHIDCIVKDEEFIPFLQSKDQKNNQDNQPIIKHFEYKWNPKIKIKFIGILNVLILV